MAKERTVKEAMGSLASSSLFRLSRGSRERFHTSFLAMMSDEYPDAMSRVWSSLLGREIKIRDGGRSEQERFHMDLHVPLQGGGMLVLENKFRSLFKEDQLDKYWKKSNSADYFLALGTSTQFFRKGSCGRYIYPSGSEGLSGRHPWVYADYFSDEAGQSLLQLLRELLTVVESGDKSDEKPRSAYLPSLLCDYVGMLEDLSVIIRSFRSELSCRDKTISDLSQFIGECQQVGVNDLLWKIFASEIARQIQACVDRSKNLRRCVHIGHELAPSSRKGVAEAYIQLDSDLGSDPKHRIAGVQIEGVQYRKFVTGPFEGPSSQSVDAARSIMTDSLWFNPESSICSTLDNKGERELPKVYPIQKTTFPGFCSYRDRTKSWYFLYRYSKVSEMRIEEIVDSAIADLEVLAEKRQEIDQKIFGHDSREADSR